jgi:ribonuclease P protein component
VGFVVGKIVGPAVVRNRVRRRLRHLMASRVQALPAGTLLVVRATPPAAAATQGDLAEALDRALDRVTPVPA